MSRKEEIKKFLSNRPKVVASYGYGSGIFKQSGYNEKDKPQIDLLLVVDDLKKWHEENRKRNPKDYSLTGKLFFKYASKSKLKGVTGITYLSNISEDDKVFKYGTIEEKDLLRFLSTWESFYLPGRFQKRILPVTESKELTNSIKKNKEMALYTALLTLPKDKNKLIDVYTQICGLSYLGDTRMKFAENPRKVLNIVEADYDYFKEVYKTSNTYFKTDSKDKITINFKALEKDISMLPSKLLESIDKNEKDISIISNQILEYFTNLNKIESKKQTIKGLFTNGIVRSIQYAAKKVAKKFKK